MNPAGKRGPRGGVLGSQGGPGAGDLPDTAVPFDMTGSLGGALLILSGMAYTVTRRRNG